MRWRLLIEYDGSQFCGWQRQKGRRTVQGVIEAALAEVAGEVSVVVGAGRTDAGVHATGQVAHVDINWNHSEADLQRAVNARLPADVVIHEVTAAAPDFHARYSASRRRYEYRIWNAPVRPVLERWTQWHVPEPLEATTMARAAAAYLGEHDFGAFGHPLTRNGATVRRVTDCRVEQRDKRLVVTIEGNAFLRQQVRRMVGLLVDIGLGRKSPEAVSEFLRSQRCPVGPRLAPAHGLVLVAVEYDAQDEFSSARDGREG